MEEDDTIREWLSKVRHLLKVKRDEEAARGILQSAPDALFDSEAGRRNNAKRETRAGPTIMRPCPKCGVEFGAREMRKHKPRCDGGK